MRKSVNRRKVPKHSKTRKLSTKRPQSRNNHKKQYIQIGGDGKECETTPLGAGSFGVAYKCMDG